jgi:hypothetical protein
MDNPELRQFSGACERNRTPLLAELQRVLPAQFPAGGLMLEIASGTGQHAAHFSAGLPQWQWQPTDRDNSGFASIQAWCAGLPNVRPPVLLDVLQATWAQAPAVVDAVFCANMIHISPWATTAALMQGAARHLSARGLLFTYGPYIEDDIETSPGNAAFDADLRSRNAEWGIRNRKAVEQAAQAAGLRLRERCALPANNLLLVFQRSRFE